MRHKKPFLMVIYLKASLLMYLFCTRRKEAFFVSDALKMVLGLNRRLLK